MPDFQIDISPYDYINSCSTRDIDELIDVLETEGKVLKNNDITPLYSVMDEEWVNICNKLRSKRLLLSNNDEEIINKIANKY